MDTTSNPIPSAPERWIHAYAARFFELSSGRMGPGISDEELRSFALDCASGGYPCFRNEDPARCAEIEFLEWQANVAKAARVTPAPVIQAAKAAGISMKSGPSFPVRG
ncbi:hypothetical protein [Roseococcus sp.]|uniref:hypothetical protein n=1 Tax=Roseococcus sp. TaxID=2109646 RepID=UPI003BA86531